MSVKSKRLLSLLQRGPLSLTDVTMCDMKRKMILSEGDIIWILTSSLGHLTFRFHCMNSFVLSRGFHKMHNIDNNGNNVINANFVLL